MGARVIALGNAAAGDDGVGAAVLQALRECHLDGSVELHCLADPTALVPLLAAGPPVIVVDAVLGQPPGQVVEPSLGELAAAAPRRVSSHGLGLAEALGLARILNDGKVLVDARVVAVTISRPPRYQAGLSPEVAAAVPCAVERVLARIRELGP